VPIIYCIQCCPFYRSSCRFEENGLGFLAVAMHVLYCGLRSIKLWMQHEQLHRRRFLAAATAIIVETDAKITSSSAILSQ